MQMESDFLIKWCWQRRLQFHPQMPMKSIPIATLSYSNYPLPHNNQLWVSRKTDHFIIFPVQRIRLLGKVQQRYLLRELSREDSVLGVTAAGARSRERHALSHACHLRSQLGLLARAPPQHLQTDPVLLYSMTTGSQRQVSQDSPSTNGSVRRSGEPLPQK